MRLRIVLLALWIVLSVWILATGLFESPLVDVKDVYIGMSFWMLLLSFPLGLLVFAATAAYDLQFVWDHQPFFYCIVWASYFTAGLIQWYLFDKLFKRKQRHPMDQSAIASSEPTRQ